MIIAFKLQLINSLKAAACAIIPGTGLRRGRTGSIVTGAKNPAETGDFIGVFAAFMGTGRATMAFIDRRKADRNVGNARR